MKVVTILTLAISTSLAARISDRTGHATAAANQERLRDKPSGSFVIQLQGGHITRVDFGSRDSKPKEPRRAQLRSEGHRFSSAGSQRQPALTHQSTVNRSGRFTDEDSRRSLRHPQPTTKTPFMTHKALNIGVPSRLQKQNQSSGSAFKFNRPNTNSQRGRSSSSTSIPSHFTIQQRNTEKPLNHFNPPVVDRPVQREKPNNHFNPPVVDRPVQLNRPASGHFSPATFHFGTLSPSKSSSRRTENSQRTSQSKSSTRRPESSHRTSTKLSTRRPDISHRTQITPRPKNISRNKSVPRSQTSSNYDTNRSKPPSIFTPQMPKGIKDKFEAPTSIKDDGPSGNSIQTPVLSPNLPTSAKDIPTIYYPIQPKIAPSSRAKL